jgi:ABC-type uncharacterized transport system substrate-binding protein
MWIDMRSYVVFDNRGLIIAIDLEWTFDDAHTRMAIEGLDTDGNGVYSKAELEPLARENIRSLKDYGYFTAPRVNGQLMPIGEVVEYAHIYSNELLSLHFHLPLTTPVDPRKDEFLYKVYDPQFFIDMQYATRDSVGIVGKMPDGCSLQLSEVDGDEVRLQIKEMLLSKGREWRPPENEDYGGLFAQPVLVVCNS